MANPHKGELEFEHNGQAYTLVLDINALCEAEDAAPPHKAVALLKAAEADSLAAIRLLFWAGLRERHGLSLREAGELMQSVGAGKAKLYVAAASVLSFPPREAGMPAPRPRTRAKACGTGKRSTKAGSKPAATRKPIGGRRRGA